MSDTLNDTFNLRPLDTEIITRDGEVIVPKAESTDAAVDYDYDRTRSNLHNLLNQGQEALMHALEVAKQSEHPRAFEVVGNLVKQLADVNHQLLDLTEKKQKLQGKKEKESPQNVTNNAIFVGSTTELNKMLNDMRGPKE
jgi:predicted house-cleaning noncanonical NTP pyrophosphatase (MazG superfamily)